MINNITIKILEEMLEESKKNEVRPKYAKNIEKLLKIEKYGDWNETSTN